MSAVHPTTDPAPVGLSRRGVFGTLPALAVTDQRLIDLIAGQLLRAGTVRSSGAAAMVEMSASAS